MTLLIAVFYGIGALELRRFHQDSAALAQAVAAVPEQLPTLAAWLASVPAALRNPVRLRVEGERVGLPGPAMTPYLVGLLVLLGMLGTFLGMVVTLNGAVMALESTTDLATIRAALAAPVRGLGLAFGTSVAGVAASAMLGLLSALCRRERLQAAQQLDSAIATRLRRFSLAQQRQDTLEALQHQAGVMPEVAGQLQAMVVQLARQSQDLNQRLLAGQDAFHRSAGTAYVDLAAAVDQSLRHGLAESARLAGATNAALVQATLSGIAHEATLQQQRVTEAVQLQLDGLSARFGSTVTTVTDTWTAALARHERSSDALTQGLQAALGGFTSTFEQRSAALLGSVGQAQTAQQGELKATLAAAAQTFAQQSAALVTTLDRAHGTLQAERAAKDDSRQTALVGALEAMAGTLQRQSQQAGATTLVQQERICKTLEQTGREIQLQAQSHARETMGEIAALMQTAAEAPRAAAEMTVLLRQQLADSLVRDNGLLAERERLMASLGTLLDAVNAGAGAQRGAIDALVAASAGLLQQVGSRFTETIALESGKLGSAAAQITGSAVEVASLGEAFGFAVQQFSASNDTLVGQLQRIEGALAKSTARSDEQLAYYVAQARELIDLSIAAQQQTVERLQQVAGSQAALAGEVA
jgi:hypothetical protein